MRKWPWKVYGIFLTILVFSGLEDVFYKNSSFYMYYTILMAFHKRYVLFLVFNIMANLLNVLAALVVFCYAFDVRGSLKFWRIYFFVRIIFDLVGHHYDVQFIKSAFVQSYAYGFTGIGVVLVPLLPSYLAHYFYAFRRPLDPSPSPA